jgi:hypothetical protein
MLNIRLHYKGNIRWLAYRMVKFIYEYEFTQPTSHACASQPDEISDGWF